MGSKHILKNNFAEEKLSGEKGLRFLKPVIGKPLKQLTTYNVAL